MKQFQVLLIAVVVMFGCSPSTQIVKSWQEPAATLQVSPEVKILTIAMVKDETSRRVIEDQLVKQMKGHAVASYTFLTPELLKEANSEKLTEKIKEGKYNYILLMRLGDVEKETSYVPGTTSYYGGYGRYYGYGANMYSSPGYYTTDKNYFIETIVYSVDPDKLLWTGTTKTVNPTSIEKTVSDIATVVIEKMRKDGFLK
jgi:hypothetical protein